MVFIKNLYKKTGFTAGFAVYNMASVFFGIPGGFICVPNLTWSHYRLILRLSDKTTM